MDWKRLLPFFALILASLACADSAPTVPAQAPAATLAPSPAPEGTLYGFFGTPPVASLDGMLAHFKALGENADFVLVQENIPWEDFLDGVEGESKSRDDRQGQHALLQQNGLDAVVVIDPLNGLNRREFFGLPGGWEASFNNPDVRSAFRNFTLWMLREFKPRYLGLASEINTYQDAHPDDFPFYLSLYHEVYALVKAEAPETLVFVTFQWEDLNNMFEGAAEGRRAGETNWEQVEVYEPNLDLWAISSYPYFVFDLGSDIPADYYTPLLERTDKPLAVAEGGFTSSQVGTITGSEQDQVDYLNAIHEQLGARLDFWAYLLLSDLDMDSFDLALSNQGLDPADFEELSWFAHLGLTYSDGTPKPALEVWNTFRQR